MEPCDPLKGTNGPNGLLIPKKFPRPKIQPSPCLEAQHHPRHRCHRSPRGDSLLRRSWGEGRGCWLGEFDKRKLAFYLWVKLKGGFKDFRTGDRKAEGQTSKLQDSRIEVGRAWWAWCKYSEAEHAWQLGCWYAGSKPPEVYGPDMHESLAHYYQLNCQSVWGVRSYLSRGKRESA